MSAKSPPASWNAAMKRHSATESGANGASTVRGEPRSCIRAADGSTLTVSGWPKRKSRCEPLVPLPQTSVLPLHVRRTDTIRIRIPEDCGADGPLDFCWPVVVSPASWKTAIELDDLSVVASIAQTSVYGVSVGSEGVRRHLKGPRGCVADFGNEVSRVGFVSLAQMPRYNQFRVALQGNESVSVADRVPALLR